MADSYHIIDGQVVPYSGGRKCNNTDAWRDATPLELQLQEQLAESEHAIAAQADEIEALRAEVDALRAEVERLRDLCDDLYSDLLAAGSLAPRDCGAYALIQETIKLRRDRWARKHAPNA